MNVPAHLPTRLHHTAYVTRNMEATRHFYEDLIGLPMVATWCETAALFGAERVYCHCFFGIADGGALAFFQFAKPEDAELFGPKMPPSPFHHIALNCNVETQRAARERLEAAGYKEPDIYLLEHGYCTSFYATDPNGMIVELVVDDPSAAAGAAHKRATAHSELKRWLAGDHRPNNIERSATPELTPA
ncbi:MAG TPA: VOC family protein [Bryobacteraceae bacterium]|nr:VOC family protein [Bryobacteraceae bacterium]